MAVPKRVLPRRELIGGEDRSQRRDFGWKLTHDPRRPAAIGEALRHLHLRVRAAEDDIAQRVDDEQLAGTEPARFHDVGWIEVDDADLRPGDDGVVARDLVPAGPQPVAVQGRAGDDAVAEGQGGRAVPWLHEPGMVLVEAAQRRMHLGDALPRLR